MEKSADKGFLKTLGLIVAAPFIGIASVVALPFSFLVAMGMSALHNILGLAQKGMSFGWRPLEAYLGGGKKSKGEKNEEEQ
ncbi:MAG TPA: hypothetical protein VEI96_12175 [Thermodesulfovibrionales bacterium]|nr:hypothetical protein [Thermodesulfovibrionales bacterium]